MVSHLIPDRRYWSTGDDATIFLVDVAFFLALSRRSRRRVRRIRRQSKNVDVSAFASQVSFGHFGGAGLYQPAFLLLPGIVRFLQLTGDAVQQVDFGDGDAAGEEACS